MLNMIPGKNPEYQMLSRVKSYTAICKVLGLDHLLDQAQQVDEANGLTEAAREKAAKEAQEQKLKNRQERKKNEQAQKENAKRKASPPAAEGNEAEAHKRQKSTSEQVVSSAPELAPGADAVPV